MLCVPSALGLDRPSFRAREEFMPGLSRWAIQIHVLLLVHFISGSCPENLS